MSRKILFNRRQFFVRSGAIGAGLSWFSRSSLAGAPILYPGASTASPDAKSWKMDLTLYDRPGWTNHGWYHRVEEDGTILVPVQSTNMTRPFGDFLRTDTDDLVLKSTDGGRAWSIFRDPGLTAYPWGCYGLPGKGPDGNLVSVICATDALSPEERREHLKHYGIERFYNSTSQWLYTPWPASMAEALRKKGIYVFGPFDEGDNQLVFSLNGFVCRTSSDGGKSWTKRSINDLPFNSDEAGSFRNTLITRRGAWVASVFGTPNPDRKPVTNAEFTSSQMPSASFALRSEDQGNSWQLVRIGYDPSGNHSYDETALLELPSGRLLAMLRHTDWTDRQKPTRYLYQSYSDDDGKTWSPPANSGLEGYPAHLLLLRSGKILCTYGYRFAPWGHRAALSADEGKTWDIQEIKMLRDDSLPGWTTYPMSSQLSDGTIFTTYGNLKSAAPGEMPAPTKLFGDGRHGRYVYVGASLYSEDFVRPLGRGDI